MQQRAAHDICLLRGAVDLFPALIQAMDAAQRDVRLETYIFDTAGAAADVAHALVRAAQRGVWARVICQRFGAHALMKLVCNGACMRP